MRKGKEITKRTYNNLLKRIAEILNQARNKVVREINKAQVLAYWEIGREIVEFEQKGKARAKYGIELIKRLSEDMTRRFGRGFSQRNLEQMRKFYLTFPQKSQTMSAKSKEETSYTESQLEQAIIDKLQYFLLEIGKGFSFVLIDLKTGELDHSDIGQMNFYLNYFKENEKTEDENDPIGLLLCAKKDDIFAKYVLGGLSNKIFASKYKLALPTEKELKAKLKSLPLFESNSERKE